MANPLNSLHKPYFDKTSVAYRMRLKRVIMFIEFIHSITTKEKVVEILDLGGTVKFWETFDLAFFLNSKSISITILNLTQIESQYSNIQTILGDACNLAKFKDKSIDIIFSNSVIEHVGNYDRQKKMTSEIRRVGKNYFVQTPNYYFPIEPHYRLFFFQFLPKILQVFLLTHFKVEGGKRFSKEQAINSLKCIRLLKYKELRLLFPESIIHCERIFGLIKSFIVTYSNNKLLVNNTT